MPGGLEWEMLSKDEKLRLRSLSKEHAENIGLHILAAFALEESDQPRALEHAKWVARQASRVDFARETLAFVAYRAGDYALALKEFRTAKRMNGQLDYLPFIADCLRGIGKPEKAVELALSDEAKELKGDSKAEMFLVFAGAYADMGDIKNALKVIKTLESSKGLSGGYRMRAVQAEQNFLEMAGREDLSQKLDTQLDELEEVYADEDEESEDFVVDNDLENITDEGLEDLGIDLSDFDDHAPVDVASEESTEESTESADSDETAETDESESDESDSESAPVEDEKRVEPVENESIESESTENEPVESTEGESDESQAE
jgi:tetratricopeptide (TPR) repeat protein